LRRVRTHGSDAGTALAVRPGILYPGIGSEHRADGVTIRTYEAIYRPDADPIIAERVAIGMAVDGGIGLKSPEPS
jgi:hypothetical protein